MEGSLIASIASRLPEIRTAPRLAFGGRAVHCLPRGSNHNLPPLRDRGSADDSMMRARVAAVVSSGSSSRLKNPCATISKSGTGAPICRKFRTTKTATWSRVESRSLKNIPCSSGGAVGSILPLAQLANERIDQRLARLDAAPRQVPAAHIAVLDQKDAAVRADHQGAHAERHAAVRRHSTSATRCRVVSIAAAGPSDGSQSSLPRR